MPTPAQVIEYSKISEYLAAIDVSKGQLFGTRKIPLSPTIIYMERKALEWYYDMNQVIEGVAAVGGVEITFIGFQGDKVEFLIDDPVLGDIYLGEYTRQSGDTTVEILAGSIVSSMSTDRYGLEATGANIEITAPLSLGSTINGGGRLSVLLTPTTTFPAVYTLLIDMITSTTVNIVGQGVTNGAVSFFNESGFALSTSPNPDLSDTLFTAGAGSGNFGPPVTGLTSGTTYYMRPFVTYGATTIFGEQQTFTTL